MSAPIHGANTVSLRSFFRDRERFKDVRKRWIIARFGPAGLKNVPISRRELISYRGDVKYGEDKVKDAVQKMFHFHC